MLVIGHRGAAGSAPENTIEAMHHGKNVGADMLEFDVQLTRDKVPIVIHDATLRRTHRKYTVIRFTKLSGIQRASSEGHQIATLEDLLDEFFGKVLLNLEVKSYASVKAVAILLQTKYIKKPEDWNNILVSSLKPSALVTMRRLCPDARLSFVHYRNPYVFILLNRKLRLSAIGFERTHFNGLVILLARKTNIFTYTYFYDGRRREPLPEKRNNELARFTRLKIDGIVTDYPEEMKKYLSKVSV